MNISEFDYKMKDAILHCDSSTIEPLLYKSSILFNSKDAKIIWNSLFRLYSKNSFFQSLVRDSIKQKFLLDNIKPLEDEYFDYKFDYNTSSNILIFSPMYTLNSAGSRVLHFLYTYLQSNGYNVDFFQYNCSFDLKEIFSNLHRQYQVVIIPETVSHIPFIPKKLLVYNLNPVQHLPKVTLGRQPVEALNAIQLNFFQKFSPHSIDLRINTINFEKFVPNKNPRTGGVGIYLGKTETNQKHKLCLNSTALNFKSRLIITRNWPNNSEIPSFAKELDLLVTLDPISSINYEFAIAGCPVYFHPEFLTSDLKNLILKDHSFNPNFRLDKSNLLKLSNTANLKTFNEHKQKALTLQNRNLSRFKSFIDSLLTNGKE